MNDVDGLERRISDHLHCHSHLAPDGDGWEGILDRIEHRARVRHRRRAAATGLVVVGIVGSLVVLSGDDGTRVSTTPPAGPDADSGTGPIPGEVERDVLHVEVTTEMCQARNAWLKAREVGDTEIEAAAFANLGSVLEKGTGAGLGETGDILVVTERLLDAMAAGDEAAVSSIPEGGACS